MTTSRVVTDPDELTAKARIRVAALELFAEYGPGSVSIRRIAERAGVSANLVIHHYGSKDGLRDAVDDAAVARFSAAFAAAASDGPPSQVAMACAREIARLGREDPYLLDYLAHALVDAGPRASRMFDTLFALMRDELARLREAGAVRTAVALDLQALQSVSRLLAPLLLRRLIDRHVPASMSPDEQRERWLAASMDLLQHGLFTAPSD